MQIALIFQFGFYAGMTPVNFEICMVLNRYKSQKKKKSKNEIRNGENV